jgi:hypothetical protein
LKRQLHEAIKEQFGVDYEHRKHLIYYARKDCLDLAKTMHQKLPAEIRNFIYECICVEPNRPIPVGPYYHFRKYDQMLRVPPEKLYTVGVGPQLRWSDLHRRHVDPNSFAAHIGRVAGDDVEMGEAPETDASNDSADQAEECRHLDDRQLATPASMTTLSYSRMAESKKITARSHQLIWCFLGVTF